jgi:hypothetical protein
LTATRCRLLACSGSLNRPDKAEVKPHICATRHKVARCLPPASWDMTCSRGSHAPVGYAAPFESYRGLTSLPRKPETTPRPTCQATDQERRPRPWAILGRRHVGPWPLRQVQSHVGRQSRPRLRSLRPRPPQVPPTEQPPSTPRPSDVPAVPIAPGLVARSVFIGMQAIDPRLRTSFPQLAMDLVSGREQIGLPVGLRLRAAMYLSREARLAGPIHSYRVLTRSEAYPSQAEIYFPLTRVDLRMLTRTFPLVRHPLSRAPDEWVSLTNDDIAPILVGDVQPR